MDSIKNVTGIFGLLIPIARSKETCLWYIAFCLWQRNNRGPVESFAEQSQVIKNGFGLDSNVVAQASLTNAQNSPESELGTAAVYKALDQPTVSATPLAASNVQRKTNVFDPAVTAGMLAESLQESVPDAENMLSQPQSQWWHARPYATEHAVPTNTLNEQEGAVDSGSISISSVYSQEWASALLPFFSYLITVLPWLPKYLVSIFIGM